MLQVRSALWAPPDADASSGSLNAPPASPEAAPDPVAALVADLDALWAKHIPDSAFSRNTEAHNRLHALFAGLKQAVAESR